MKRRWRKKHRRKRRDCVWIVTIASEGRRRWSERIVAIWREWIVATVRLGFGNGKECEGSLEVEASPKAFGSWIVPIVIEGRRWRRFICNRCELKLGFGDGEASEPSRSEASELSRRWGWVLATVRYAKGCRKSNRRRFEGMRRVAIWSGYRCGYQRFGVGISVYLTATAYSQPSQAEVLPLSLIGDGWAQRRRWLESSSSKGAEFFFFFFDRKSDGLFCGGWFFWVGWLLKLGVFSDEFQFRH